MKDTIDRLRDLFSTEDMASQKKDPVYPQVDEEKCTGCGLCTKVCPGMLIRLEEGKPKFSVMAFECVECGHCVAICPTGAMMDPVAEKSDNKDFNPKQLPSSAALQTLFRARRTGRHYQNKPVSRAALEKMIEAGRYAPCGGNRPDVHYLVLTDREEIDRLAGVVLESSLKMFITLDNKLVASTAGAIIGQENISTVVNYIPVLKLFKELREKNGEDRVFYHAPAIMLTHGKKWDDTIDFSNAAAIYQASLMAETMNIGCCFNGFLQVGINKDPQIKKMLGIPGGHKCYGAMTLGYRKLKYQRLVRRRPAQVTWR